MCSFHTAVSILRIQRGLSAPVLNDSRCLAVLDPEGTIPLGHLQKVCLSH